MLGLDHSIVLVEIRQTLVDIGAKVQLVPFIDKVVLIGVRVLVHPQVVPNLLGQRVGCHHLEDVWHQPFEAGADTIEVVHQILLIKIVHPVPKDLVLLETGGHLRPDLV